MAKNDDWYDSPLYYDLIFDEDTEIEADFLEALMWKHGVANTGRILEPACGSGRMVDELARRGYSVDGFDLNENMLEFARMRLKKNQHQATLWTDSLENFKAKGTYDLAHCMVSTFKYISSEAGAIANLQRVADCLHQGGLYVIGLHLTRYGITTYEHERWVVDRPDIKVVSNTRTWPADRKRRIEHLRNRLKITRRNGVEKKLETNWPFRTYDAAQLRKLIASVPAFEAVAFHDFNYNIKVERKLDNEYEDIVVVLRKR